MDVRTGERNRSGEAAARRQLGANGVAAMDAQTETYAAKGEAGDQYLKAIQRMDESQASLHLSTAALRTPRQDIPVAFADRAALSTLSGDLNKPVEQLLVESAKTAAAGVVQNLQGATTRGFYTEIQEVSPKSVYGQAAQAVLAVSSSRPLAQGAASTAAAAVLSGLPTGPMTQILARIGVLAMDSTNESYDDKSAAARPLLQIIAAHTEDWNRSQVAAAALTSGTDGFKQYGTYMGALKVLVGDTDGTADQALTNAAEQARKLVVVTAGTEVSKPFLNYIPKS